MSRRLLTAIIMLIPALALIVWLVAAQLPRWTAPQPNWFSGDPPGVCAAVESLKLYQGVRTDANGISSDEARAAAAHIAADHYGVSAQTVSDPLAVQATLPGQPPQTVYLITVGLSDGKAAVIYLDAADGKPLALITAVASAARCNFDVRAALVAAAKSPPVPLLITYVGFVVVALVARLLWTRRGRHR